MAISRNAQVKIFFRSCEISISAWKEFLSRPKSFFRNNQRKEPMMECRRNLRVARHVAKLSFLILILSMTDVNGFLYGQPIKPVEADESQAPSEVDKSVQYTKHLQTHCTGQKIRIADIVDKYDVLVPS